MKKTPMARLDAIMTARADALPWLQVNTAQLASLSDADRAALLRKANTCNVVIRSGCQGSTPAARMAAEKGEALLQRSGLLRGAITILRSYTEQISR